VSGGDRPAAPQRVLESEVVIRQIAALPYRSSGGTITVLLVTSRQTRRWVLPKGNKPSGLPRHAAAALEAEEEAGVRGAACPTPIGSYRYRKTRWTGASLMVDVEVFPIAVTDELPDWKERAERERRWFDIAEAAAAVDEPDLRSLILGFRPPSSAAERRNWLSPGSAVAGLSRGASMFGWVRALLPRQGDFFGMFEAHAATLCAGSEALVRLLQGSPGMPDHIREIAEREHEADDIIRDVLRTVRRTSRTPFDRRAIVSLINAMDDAIDQMHQTAGAVGLYEVAEFEPGMKDMAAIIVDAARITAEALPLLRDIRPNAARLHELTERLVRMEGQADDIHAKGLKSLFLEHGRSDTLRFVVSREIYGHLERVVDRFEDIADEIDGLVIGHA